MCCGKTAHRAGGGLDVGDLLLRLAGLAWWLLCRTVAPALVVAVVLAWRWLSGRPMSGRAGTSWLRGGPAPGRVTWRTPRWACWPGWCRAVVRWTATAVTAGLAMCPAATVAVVSVAVAAGSVFVWWRRRPTSAPSPAGPTEQVRQPVAALPAAPRVTVWDAAPSDVRERVPV